MLIRAITAATAILFMVACSDQTQPSSKKNTTSSHLPQEQSNLNDASVDSNVSNLATVSATATPGAPTADFQYLPLLADADGNPNDSVATYNLTVDANVPVTVVTPTAKWTTPMMRYNGLQLPPVIMAKRGTNITVNVQNNLVQDTTVHWHGFKIPADQDGGPDLPIAAGATRTYGFGIAQAAAPLWFHPHADGTTATQVYKGLAGAFIVTDDITQSLEDAKQLPSGAYDIPMLVQDRSFSATTTAAGIRTLVYRGGMMGMMGNRVLVNGVQQPTLKVATRQYRFKILNGSNARSYDFVLSDSSLFTVVGTDGGLLPSPVRTDHITLSAGERAEIVVDFRSMALNSTLSLVNRITSGGAARDVIFFNVATQADDDVTLYTSLPTQADINERIPVASVTKTRNFVLNTVGMMSFAINGKLFNMNRIDERVSSNATEIWAISNATMMAHPFHAHAIQWQVLDRSGVPSTGVDLGWKDTVLVQPGETVRIIGKFDPVINKGLYLYHCHILEHEEAGMMGTFFIQ